MKYLPILLLFACATYAQTQAITKDSGPIYQKADIGSKRLVVFNKGESIKILKEGLTFHLVEYQDTILGYTLAGNVGYVNAPKPANYQSQPVKSSTGSRPCPSTSRCGCSSYNKAACNTTCCSWTVGYGCGCR